MDSSSYYTKDYKFENEILKTKEMLDSLKNNRSFARSFLLHMKKEMPPEFYVQLIRKYPELEDLVTENIKVEKETNTKNRNHIKCDDPSCDCTTLTYDQMIEKTRAILNTIKHNKELSRKFLESVMQKLPTELLTQFGQMFPEVLEITGTAFGDGKSQCQGTDIFDELFDRTQQLLSQNIPNAQYVAWLELYEKSPKIPITYPLTKLAKTGYFCFVRTLEGSNPIILDFSSEFDTDVMTSPSSTDGYPHLCPFLQKYNKFAYKFAYPIMKPSNLELIKKYTNKVISIGCGNGYPECELQRIGIDTLCFDIKLPNAKDHKFTDILIGSAEKLEENQKHTLMLSWPPQAGHPGSEMSEKCVLNYRGNIIIYLGEPEVTSEKNMISQTKGANSTATIEFFAALKTRGFKLVEWEALAQVPHLHGYIFIYKRYCSVCSGDVKSQCAGCKKVKYCSQKCQIKDWPTHKKSCQ